MLEHLNAVPVTPQRVVLLGAGGFVGSAILARLAAERIETLALSRRQLDLLDPQAAARLAGMLRAGDSVVMVSAVVPARTPELLLQNLRMAQSVCAALDSAPISHLLYISSDAVYADDENPVTERSHRSPSTLHGMMHAARELMLSSATDAPVAILRPTLIYGARDPHNGYGPNRFRRQAEAGGPITIFGEGEERRDHVLVDDVAALAVLILRHRSRGALNAATGASISFHDIAHLVSAQFGGVEVRSVPRPGPRPHLLHRFFDIACCYKAFPQFRYTPLAQGLAASVKSGRN